MNNSLLMPPSPKGELYNHSASFGGTKINITTKVNNI